MSSLASQPVVRLVVATNLNPDDHDRADDNHDDADDDHHDHDHINTNYQLLRSSFFSHRSSLWSWHSFAPLPQASIGVYQSVYARDWQAKWSLASLARHLAAHVSIQCV